MVALSLCLSFDGGLDAILLYVRSMNDAYETGQLPERWQTIIIFAVPKARNLTKPDDCKGISFISAATNLYKKWTQTEALNRGTDTQNSISDKSGEIQNNNKRTWNEPWPFTYSIIDYPLHAGVGIGIHRRRR